MTEKEPRQFTSPDGTTWTAKEVIDIGQWTDGQRKVADWLVGRGFSKDFAHELIHCVGIHPPVDEHLRIIEARSERDIATAMWTKFEKRARDLTEAIRGHQEFVYRERAQDIAWYDAELYRKAGI